MTKGRRAEELRDFVRDSFSVVVDWLLFVLGLFVFASFGDKDDDDDNLTGSENVVIVLDILIVLLILVCI